MNRQRIPPPSSPRRSVRLSVRLLGVLDALIRANRRLRDQEPVTLNPSATVIDGYLHYIRQGNGEVACVRLPLSPALRWVLSAGPSVSAYVNWIDLIRIRFRATGMQAHQYIDKLIELGLLHHTTPVSAADPAWDVQLRHWLTKLHWLAPAFVSDLLRLLDALLAAARTLTTATAPQRATLLHKSHLVLSERVSRLAQPPPADFWPLHPDQLFTEADPQPADRGLTIPCSSRFDPLAMQFQTKYAPTEAVPVVSIFEQYLGYEDPIGANDRSVRTVVQPVANGSSGNALLVEPTDDHYDDALVHPAWLNGAILTPGGHVPPYPTDHLIRLNQLVVRLSDDAEHLQLWHRPSGRRVEVIDPGSATGRSALYTFLCRFTPTLVPSYPVPEVYSSFFTP